MESHRVVSREEWTKAREALLAEEKEFHFSLVSAPQSADELDGSGILLSQCRSELEEALDDLSAPPLAVERQRLALRLPDEFAALGGERVLTRLRALSRLIGRDPVMLMG